MSYDNWKLATPDTDQETETEILLCCDECGDEILKNQQHFNNNGFPICDYCRTYILQKN